MPVAYDSQSVPVNKEEEFAHVRQTLDEYRERFGQQARKMFPRASDQDIKEVADLAFQIPSEIFHRRNLWGMKFE